MTDRAPAEVRNLDQYGSPPLAWSRARDLLATGVAGREIAFFLCTTGRMTAPTRLGSARSGSMAISTS